MIRYNQIVSNLSLLPQFIAYYEKELKEAKTDVIVHGNLEQSLRDLPGITEHRFNQLQEIEAVLVYMQGELRKIKKKHYKDYLEGYAKALTSRDAGIYADAEDEVIDYEVLINEVALVRNKYLGIIKGIEQKSFQLSAISRLRTAGMQDLEL